MGKKKTNKKVLKQSKFKFIVALFIILSVLYVYQNKEEIIYKLNIQLEQENVANKGEVLVLVNSENPLKEDYKVDLVEFKNSKISNIIIKDLEYMYKDAEKDGITLNINNSYRSLEEQEEIYNDRIKKYEKQGMTSKDARLKTEEEVQKPGFSEHHTGLAIDFSTDNGKNVKIWKWLYDNAYKYGFILRYPQGKADITKVTYEPWHYRYVGKDVSKKIYKSKLTLEEYLLNISSK